MDDFDALRADDDDLAKLRDDLRRFLAADAAQFGWQPGVDCWLSNHGAPVAAHWIADRQVAPALLTYGSEDQRRRLLPRIASGTLYSAIGMSEHEAGSDLAAVTTKATHTDSGWQLNGSKVWTSGAHLAHQIVVLARTSPLDPKHRHAGFSQFIVPTDAPGVTIEPIVQMNGEHHFNEVLFDDVVLTDADLLGTVGAGWHQVTSELGFERSGPERFLSTATLLFALVEALRDDPRADVGDLMARMISLRQLSISVARALTAGRDAAVSAALVKDLGTRFEQDSVEIAAELLDRYDGPDRPRLQAMLDTARVHAPLFTLRGGTNEVLRGIVAKNWTKQSAAEQHSDEHAELRELAEQIGRTAAPARTLPLTFDDALWRTAEGSGLTRLSSDADAGPAAAAVVLGTLARHAAAVPIAETDVLATWLAAEAGLSVPQSGPLALAPDGVATWPQCGPVVVAARKPDALYVALRDTPALIDGGHNLAGEPRAAIEFDTAAADVVRLPLAIADELTIRGAWCRCVQIVGAFDAAAQLTVAHTETRVQFGRPLAVFQAVQHSLATMLGEIERARAATTLAVTAAAQYGFGDDRTVYATTVAKVAVGRAVGPVTTIAHQLHGAIGTTAEHPLWRATTRARSWADAFGSTSWHARRLASRTATTTPWDVTVGRI